jgi:prolyl oligopeptidase
MTVAEPEPEDAAQDTAVDELGGVRFADPLRWLEDESDEVEAWQLSQARRASAYARDWPRYGELKGLVERYLTERVGTVPAFGGGRWFHVHTPEGTSYPQVLVSEEAYGEGHVVADLADYQVGDNAPFVTWLSPSPDGRVLAMGVCTDGSEQNTIQLIDVASARPLDNAPTQVLHDGWTGGAAWLADSSGFYFLGLVGSVHDFRQAVFLHRLGAPSPVEPENVPGIGDDSDYTVVQVSKSGRWAVASHRLMNPIPVAVLDLAAPDSVWKPFITRAANTVAGQIVGDRYVAVTDVGAPRGRLVAIALDAPDPDDSTKWTELLPASETVLRSVHAVASHLYLLGFDSTYATLRVMGPDRDVVTLPLPGDGAIAQPGFPMMALASAGHPEEFIFSFSTFVSSWATYRHRPGAAELELLKPAEITLDAAVSDYWATSADGTRIPYHVLRAGSPSAVTPSPALMYAYGGFNVPLLPQYPSAGMAAFVVAGGVYVHVHLRGGGEFGRDWWEGGRMKNKQNCYADLFAVAEDLAARNITTCEQLALVGGSNGGLLCGNAVTQRPELWKAVVPRVPIADLIGACRYPYDEWCTRIEYADIEEPREVRRLARFSPYHLVEDGVSYPAVYVDAGATDPRCPPFHARKLAARLQAAQAGDAPILLHVWKNVGHGWATEESIALDQNTEWLAFAMKTLGF